MEMLTRDNGKGSDSWVCESRRVVYLTEPQMVCHGFRRDLRSAGSSGDNDPLLVREASMVCRAVGGIEIKEITVRQMTVR